MKTEKSYSFKKGGYFLTREKIKYKYLSYASHLPLDIFKDKNSNIFIGNIVIDLNLTRRILKASPRCFFPFVDRLHASSFAPSSPPHSFHSLPVLQFLLYFASHSVCSLCFHGTLVLHPLPTPLSLEHNP